MWWLLIFIEMALIVGMVAALNWRGPGDPNYRSDDARSGEALGGPGGQWGPGRWCGLLAELLEQLRRFGRRGLPRPA